MPDRENIPGYCKPLFFLSFKETNHIHINLRSKKTTQDAATYEAFKPKTSTLETQEKMVKKKNALQRKEWFVYLANLLLVTEDLKKEVNQIYSTELAGFSSLPE